MSFFYFVIFIIVKNKALELNRNEFIIYLLYLLGQVSSHLSILIYKNWAVTYLKVLWGWFSENAQLVPGTQQALSKWRLMLLLLLLFLTPPLPPLQASVSSICVLGTDQGSYWYLEIKWCLDSIWCAEPQSCTNSILMAVFSLSGVWLMVDNL